MIGVGVAEKAGMMGALIRKLVKVAPAATLAFFIVLRRRPVERRLRRRLPDPDPARRGSVRQRRTAPPGRVRRRLRRRGCSFAVNVLITPVDSMLTEITNEAIDRQTGAETIDVTANLCFSIASSIFVAVVITFIVQRITEPALGQLRPAIPVEQRGGRGAAAASRRACGSPCTRCS